MAYLMSMLDDEFRVVSVVEDSYHNNVNATFILADIQDCVDAMSADSFDGFA